jgi:hypothetical protein
VIVEREEWLCGFGAGDDRIAAFKLIGKARWEIVGRQLTNCNK